MKGEAIRQITLEGEKVIGQASELTKSKSNVLPMQLNTMDSDRANNNNNIFPVAYDNRRQNVQQ